MNCGICFRCNFNHVFGSFALAVPERNDDRIGILGIIEHCGVATISCTFAVYIPLCRKKCNRNVVFICVTFAKSICSSGTSRYKFVIFFCWNEFIEFVAEFVVIGECSTSAYNDSIYELPSPFVFIYVLFLSVNGSLHT